MIVDSIRRWLESLNRAEIKNLDWTWSTTLSTKVSTKKELRKKKRRGLTPWLYIQKIATAKVK